MAQVEPRDNHLDQPYPEGTEMPLYYKIRNNPGVNDLAYIFFKDSKKSHTLSPGLSGGDPLA